MSYEATPATLSAVLPMLGPGDTVHLAAGTYAHFTVSGTNGSGSAWITITGPENGAPAIVEADPGPCCNTIEIVSSSYIAIRHLRVDNKGVRGAFAISAKSGVIHHIRIEDNELVFTNADQNDCGISTKIQTWGWEIRGNRIEGAGTGLYLGNSDGNMPFVQGLIERNLVLDPVGYDMEIKHQNPWPTGTGLPTGPTTTVIRHNVFIKGDGPSPSGDRPNVLFDGFPDTGPGSSNHYDVYGNVFFHNPREALLQASGDFSIHDNLFVESSSPAIVVTAHAGKAVVRAYVYNNTILTGGTGLAFSSAATIDDLVTGNLIFAATPFNGTIANSKDNLTAPVSSAGQYVRSPVMALPGVDLFPLPGAVRGSPLNLSKVQSQLDALNDYNASGKGDLVFRGAYASDDANCGWTPTVGIKPQSTSCDGGTGGGLDAGPLDAGPVDGGPNPAAPVDGGTLAEPAVGTGCSCGASYDLLAALLMVLPLARLSRRARARS